MTNLEYIKVTGGQELHGDVQVSGAKNAALPLLFASLMAKEPVELTNVPDLDDISVTLRLLQSLGAKVSFDNGKARIQTPEITRTEAPYSLVKRLRASFWVMGPLLARVGEARVALPGGDAIGTRPVDLHIKGFQQMGADVRLHQGAVVAHAPGGLHPAHIVLDYPSVGATHNLLMAAAGVNGESVIDGAAREPEVVALAEFLNSMGANIEGYGTSCITINGTSELSSGTIDVLGDRIEAVTYLLAGAVTGGAVTVRGIDPVVLDSALCVLEQMDIRVQRELDMVSIQAPKILQAVSFETGPCPALATDVQPLFMAALTKAKGVSSVTEKVFENRFGHVAEYRRLGARIHVSGRVATVEGVELLSAAPVEATDIRAAAGLVLMGLAAEGETFIHEIYHLDRGYNGMVEKLQRLGAKIQRAPEMDQRELVIGC